MVNEPIKWQAPEYHFEEKRADWYIAVGIIAVSVIVTAIIFGNFIFAVLIALGIFALLIFAHRKPKIVTFEIGRGGIVADKTLHPWNSIESFWVETRIEPPKLLIKLQKVLVPLIAIPLTDISPETVREMLLEKLTEVEHREPLAEKILERLGF
ncbi:MAG: hypothetical protein UY17_C0022G0002 [Candidatus Beckwithbacteria bacterium GW2011_GWC2_47_9]|uniref:DUF5673 domain-containing protein n=1 Tax=Candidatus Beckwithbacteria bacterium GW2011_GWC2_47_9 TaxID=1618373 RepID=A0A0G1WAD0_9BACT|nr:MAG: hypothetical protein UX94_C0011G0002 [Parcubacteria group bacterium GW2011_GWA2_47_21]KKU87288.1 MAG: hypothetical protein UY17_C0022G0002 [Candidatus Beckwithbacteria bacterium GW2011_GWC2_47_9]